MTDHRLDYWRETVRSSFEEHGIEATELQILSVAADIQIGVENQSLAFHDPPHPVTLEVERLTEQLAVEKSKVNCIACDGTGRVFYPGPYHSAETDCFACHGKGRIIP